MFPLQAASQVVRIGQSMAPPAALVRSSGTQSNPFLTPSLPEARAEYVAAKEWNESAGWIGFALGAAATLLLGASRRAA